MLKPIDGRVFVRQINNETTKSGIILQSENSSKFEVVAIADGVTDVKVGDTIICDKFAGVVYEDGRIITIDDIFGILEDD